LLAERETGQLPPYRAMAILRAESDIMSTSLKLLDDIKSKASGSGIESWGPLPALIARRADRHRAQLIMVSNNRVRLNRQLAALCQDLDRMKLPADVKWAIDVDPLETG